MSEARRGPGLRTGEARGWGGTEIPRFVIGCEDDEQDMGQMEAAMNNKMFREEEMEDDEDESPAERQIVVGICAMMKKSKSKPMTQILERLCKFDYIDVVIFPEEVILEEPVEKWPLCDCLISFHSKVTVCEFLSMMDFSLLLPDYDFESAGIDSSLLHLQLR